MTSTADFPDLLSLEVIAESQNLPPPPANSRYTLTDGSVPVWKNAQRKLHAPPDDEELDIRICMTASCSAGGH